MEHVNGPVVLVVVLAIVAGLGWVFDRRDKRDRALVAEQIKNGTYRPARVVAARHPTRWE